MTIDKIKEKYLSTIVSLIVGILNYTTAFSLSMDMGSFMDKTISFSSISFGFLLTVLSLLLQSNSPAINRIKASGRFDELINFNKKAVISSALLVFCALLYIGFRPDNQCDRIILKYIVNVRTIADTIALMIFIYQATEVYLFLDLFYVIIKEKN